MLFKSVRTALPNAGRGGFILNEKTGANAIGSGGSDHSVPKEVDQANPRVDDVLHDT